MDLFFDLGMFFGVYFSIFGDFRVTSLCYVYPVGSWASVLVSLRTIWSDR